MFSHWMILFVAWSSNPYIRNPYCFTWTKQTSQVQSSTSDANFATPHTTGTFSLLNTLRHIPFPYSGWCLVYSMYCTSLSTMAGTDEVFCGVMVWVASRRRWGALLSGDGHCWGSSDGCFLGFRVSMRDWTLRFTLVLTRRVTESEDGEEGEEEEPARWEGGRATRHFWYRSWETRSRKKKLWEEATACFWDMSRKFERTTHAACTASDTLPALGSHQKTWHWKCWFPVSIMKANVCTSRPTPMKDRKRTRQSTSASSSSCTAVKTRIRSLQHIFLHLSDSGIFKSFIYLVNHRITIKFLAFSVRTAKVVSAILRMTGVQSSFPVDDKRLSMAPFIMSIPRDRAQRMLGSSQRKLLWNESWYESSCTYWPRHGCHTQIEHVKLLHQFCFWHGELYRDRERKRTKHTSSTGNFIRGQDLMASFKEGVHKR